MKQLMSKLLDNMRYPSTWKGLVTLLGVLGVTVKPELADAITQAGMAVVGAIWLLTSDSDVKPKK